MRQTENSRGLIPNIVGLILVLLLLWFFFAVIEGVIKLVLVIVCVVAAGLLVWRVFKSLSKR